MALYTPGFGTEYTENYCWTQENSRTGSKSRASGLFDSHQPTGDPPQYSTLQDQRQAGLVQSAGSYGTLTGPDPTQFQSQIYPSVYRETVIHKDDRGKYIDPFVNIATKPYGRRLMYDQSHPDKMYASQWSSELADPPGVYSFPTLTGLHPEQPWTKDMVWRVEGEEGHWPTDQWKQWTQVAVCPPYDGHSDQPEYSKYKVQVP